MRDNAFFLLPRHFLSSFPFNELGGTVWCKWSEEDLKMMLFSGFIYCDTPLNQLFPWDFLPILKHL